MENMYKNIENKDINIKQEIVESDGTDTKDTKVKMEEIKL